MPIVYILTNESMPDIIKIGITDNLSRRIKELDNTSTPLPFECYYALEVIDAGAIEKLLHEAFDDKRVRHNREFFNLSPEQAKSALKIAEKMGGADVTPRAAIVETEQDSQALEAAKKRKSKIDYFGFLDIALGEVLTFKKDKTITATVVENGEVDFRGEKMTLSRSALIVINELGYDWDRIQGPRFWCYRGKSLLELYQEVQD